MERELKRLVPGTRLLTYFPASDYSWPGNGSICLLTGMLCYNLDIPETADTSVNLAAGYSGKRGTKRRAELVYEAAIGRIAGEQMVN